MAEGPLGEFYYRYPNHLALHCNEVGKPLFKVPCHAHTYGHVRFLFAGDAPGPDGRIGWWEQAESPIRDDGGKIIGWREERNNHVRANGPDSSRWIPAGWRHQFTLLSMTGYHLCFFHNIDPATGQKTPAFTGHIGATL